MFGETNGCEQTNQFENETSQWELASTDIKMYKWWKKIKYPETQCNSCENGIYNKILILNKRKMVHTGWII